MCFPEFHSKGKQKKDAICFFNNKNYGHREKYSDSKPGDETAHCKLTVLLSGNVHDDSSIQHTLNIGDKGTIPE